MLGKLQKQVAIVEKIKVIFNKNITMIKSSRQDEKVKVLIIFWLVWTLILARFDTCKQFDRAKTFDLKTNICH